MIQKVSVAKARWMCNVQERMCRKWAMLGTEHSTEAWVRKETRCRTASTGQMCEKGRLGDPVACSHHITCLGALAAEMLM